MDYGRALAWSFGVDFQGLLLGAYPVAHGCPRRDKAREICQTLRTAQSLQVFVKDLIGGRRPWGLLDNVIRLFRRRAIECSQIWRDSRLVTTAMARIAGQHLSSAEIGLIDGR